MAGGGKKSLRLRSPGSSSPLNTTTVVNRRATRAKTPPVQPQSTNSNVVRKSQSPEASSDGSTGSPTDTKPKRGRPPKTKSAAVTNHKRGRPPKGKTPFATAQTAPGKTTTKRKSRIATPEPVEPKEYEVQCIRSHYVGAQVEEVTYYTKWLGYSEAHNTYEVEGNFSTYLTLYKYWNNVHCGRTNGSGCDKELARAVMIQHEWQTESIRFHVKESLFYKKLIDSDMINKYDWSNYSNYCFPIKRSLRETSIEEYNHNLGLLTRLCNFYPDIRVENFYDRFMPMALHNFLPFSVRPDMVFMEREKEMESNDFTRNHLSEKNLMRALRVLKSLLNKDMNPVNLTEHSILKAEIHMQAIFDWNSLRTDKSEFQSLCKLELCRTEDKCWALIALAEIKEGDVIMPITGEAVDDSEAEKCFREEGEMIAFKHFVALPKRTNLCLDRRRRSDFSRYVQHSCDPNCFVRAVTFERNKIPQGIPVLYLMAKKTIPAGTVLTLDYFLNVPIPDKYKTKGQQSDDIRAELVKKSQDHIYCTCSADPSACRNLLWVENIAGNVYTSSKKEKLKKTKIIGSNTFRGLDFRTPE